MKSPSCFPKASLHRIAAHLLLIGCFAVVWRSSNLQALDAAKAVTAPLLDLMKKKMPPKDVTPDEAERLLQLQPDVVVIDVRTSEEYALGHIRGAINVDFFDRDFAEKLKKHEGKTVLVHCASGGRSGQTITKIKDANFPAIYHLKSGFSGWQAAGKPFTK
jgi:phage shock protein E